MEASPRGRIVSSLALGAKGGEELYPMMVVPATVLGKLALMMPFQDLLERRLVRRRRPEAIVSFVSHQWLARQHPDPQGVQLRCLQAFLKRASLNRVKEFFSQRDWDIFVRGSDWDSQFAEGRTSLQSHVARCFSRHRGDETDELLAAELARTYVWIDYLSVPQDVPPDDDRQLRAIYSIPYYVRHSAFFIVLCPNVRTADGELCNYEGWLQRGWCRFEQWSNILSPQRVVPIVLTETHAWTIDMFAFLSSHAKVRAASVPCGDFTCCRFNHRREDGTPVPCDKICLLPILESMWLAKLHELSEAKNQWIYLLLRCLETRIFAWSPEEPFRAAWGWALACDAKPELVVDRIEADVLSGRVEPSIPVICIAGSLGDERVLRACVERGFDPLAADAFGFTCLSQACSGGSVAAVEYLLSLPCITAEYINAQTAGLDRFTTVLQLATTNGQTVDTLLRFRADPAKPTFAGRIPLHGAATFGHVAASKALLDAHASADSQDHRGTTPLHLAAERCGKQTGCLEVVHLLLERRASPTLEDYAGITAVDMARQAECQVAVDILRDATACRISSCIVA